MKLPSLQFYIGDWRKDVGVQSLNFHDRGVWFEILCLMHESSDRGKLLLNGRKMPDDALARLLGLDKQVLTNTLTTLLNHGVASLCPETGALMNRRMVKDENIRKMRAAAGKLGGNPVLLKQKPKQISTTKDNQNPTPSSSSSSSSSSSDKSTASPPAQLEIGVISGKRVLTDAWCEAYEKFHKTCYVFNGPRDGKAADGLLKTKIPIPELIKLAVEAWSRPNGFNCKQAASLAGFLSRINEIRHELRQAGVTVEADQIPENINVKSL